MPIKMDHVMRSQGHQIPVASAIVGVQRSGTARASPTSGLRERSRQRWPAVRAMGVVSIASQPLSTGAVNQAPSGRCPSRRPHVPCAPGTPPEGSATDRRGRPQQQGCRARTPDKTDPAGPRRRMPRPTPARRYRMSALSRRAYRAGGMDRAREAHGNNRSLEREHPRQSCAPARPVAARQSALARPSGLALHFALRWRRRSQLALLSASARRLASAGRSPRSLSCIQRRA